MKKEQKKEVLLKASDFCLDLAKLIFGGIILSGIIGLNVDKFVLVGVGLLAVIFLIWAGFMFYINGLKK
jgi:hypothetical protein